MNPGTRRYPIGPLLDLLVGRGMTRTAASRLLGMSGSSLQDAVRLGLLVKAADRCAMKAGLHPVEVWPSWVDDALEDQSKQCPVCRERFVPVRRSVIYCGQRCRRLIQQRRYRARAYAAEANREARRRYYAENAEYERMRQRRWYEQVGSEMRRAQRAERKRAA